MNKLHAKSEFLDLPTSPYISLYLPIPPYISLYLPISPYISLFHLEAHTDHRGAELLPSDVAVAVLIPLSEEVHHSASMLEQHLLELLS